MRKLISVLLPVVIAGFALSETGCTVKVQAKTEEEPKKPPPPPPKEDPPPPPKKVRKKLNFAKGFKKMGYQIDLPAPVPFKTGSAELDVDEGADDILEIVKEYLVTNPDVTLLRVEGHTDSDGDDASNMQLSKDRAASCVKWLIDHQVDCKRLMPVGFGEERPLGANDTPENKAKNRRVSFYDATIKNKPVLDEKTHKPIPVDNGGKIAVDPCNPAVKK